MRNKCYLPKKFDELKGLPIVKSEKEYEWENNNYPNLTAIAQKITRGHVSGPNFFGLTR